MSHEEYLKIEAGKYSYARKSVLKGGTDVPLLRALRDIDDRLNELEYKDPRTSKKPGIDRQQKIVLLLELGVIDYLFTLGISQKKLSKILALIINASHTNIESDLSDRFNPDSYLKSEKNYKFLLETFVELKVKKSYTEKAEKTLDVIEKKLEK
jgi:hypothetical protein